MRAHPQFTKAGQEAMRKNPAKYAKMVEDFNRAKRPEQIAKREQEIREQIAALYRELDALTLEKIALNLNTARG